MPTSDTRAEQSPLQESAWSRLWFILHLAFHAVWLSLHNTIMGNWGESFVFGRTSHFNRKVVLLGDDLALGVGDWVQFLQTPGCHGRLNRKLNKDVHNRLVGRNVLWTAFSSGVAGSTTEDWLPSAKRNPASRFWLFGQAKKKGGRNIFQSAVGEFGMHGDADVAVLIMGSRDLCDVKDTVTNLEVILRALSRERGISTVVSTLPLPRALLRNPEAAIRWRHRNNLISEMVKRVGEELGGKTTALVGMDEFVKKEEHFRFSGRMPSGAGYNAMGEALMAALTPVMRKVDGPASLKMA